jgi:hypothetical protein
MSRSSIIIRVRSTGGDNYARVLGKGITASCTMCEEAAANAAAKKHFGDRPFSIKADDLFSGATATLHQFIAWPIPNRKTQRK